jgi:hypothetical protein
MATTREDWDLEEWALMVRWPRDRDGWREFERLALLREVDGTRNDPRWMLARLGLVAETARQGDRAGYEGRERADEVSRRGPETSVIRGLAYG